MCGTPTCRGYLEVFDDDEHMREVTGLRSGLWIASMEARQLAAAAAATTNTTTTTAIAIVNSNNTQDTAEGDEGGKGTGGKGGEGEWLGHKRIKVWWEGNDAYFEADVVSYDPTSGLHKVYYLVDDDLSEEMLWTNGDNSKGGGAGGGAGGSGSGGRSGDGKVLWQMLDESREEKAIGRKKRNGTSGGGGGDEEDTTALADVVFRTVKKPFYPSPAVKQQHSGHPMSPKTVIIDKTVTIEYALCSYIFNKQYTEFLGDRMVNKKAHLFAQFAEMIKAKYDVNCRRSSTGSSGPPSIPGSSPRPSSSNSTDDVDSFRMTVIGEANVVDKVLAFVEEKRQLLWYDKSITCIDIVVVVVVVVVVVIIYLFF